MLDSVVAFVLGHAQEVLLAILSGILLLVLRQVKALPAMLASFAAELQRSAEKTPGKMDDVVASLLKAFAAALQAAVDKHIGKK